jgi:hypothetical protein
MWIRPNRAFAGWRFRILNQFQNAVLRISLKCAAQPAVGGAALAQQPASQRRIFDVIAGFETTSY